MACVQEVNDDRTSEEKVDYYCRIMPWWDGRFTRCPIRHDPAVYRCRFVLTLTGCEPRFCMILRHNGATTLRRIGEHELESVKEMQDILDLCKMID